MSFRKTDGASIEVFAVMIGANPEFLSLLNQYEAEWSAYVRRLEARLQLLQTLKQGTGLMLLTCAYLAYYLIDCMIKAILML